MRKLLRTIAFFVVLMALPLGLSAVASTSRAVPGPSSTLPEQTDTMPGSSCGMSSLDKSAVTLLAIWQRDYGVSKDAPYSVRIQMTLNDAYFTRGATGNILLYGANGLVILTGRIEESGTAFFCGPGTRSSDAREYFHMDAVDTSIRLDYGQPLYADVLIKDKSGDYEIKHVEASLFLASAR
jgi:hypothetical protein